MNFATVLEIFIMVAHHHKIKIVDMSVHNKLVARFAATTPFLATLSKGKRRNVTVVVVVVE